jgi:Zn-dependent protease with chaperone function
MQYIPSLPEQNDNVSHNHPLKEFAILLSGVTVFLLIVAWSIGLLIDWAAGYISPEMEAVIFSPMHVAGAVLNKSKEHEEHDPRQATLQRLVDNLGTCIDVGYPLQVNLAKSKAANAFAFPGGRIVVLSGLPDKVRSENGLSYILAHEMAHFKNRDHLRGMGRGLVLTAVSVLLTGAGSDITQLLTSTLGFSHARYSQERESMADALALRTLNCFYGHVGGATEFFEAMKSDEESGGKLSQYFSSHPEAVQRINDIHELASASGYAVQEVLPLPSVFTSDQITPDCPDE